LVEPIYGKDLPAAQIQGGWWRLMCAPQNDVDISRNDSVPSLIDDKAR